MKFDIILTNPPFNLGEKMLANENNKNWMKSWMNYNGNGIYDIKDFVEALNEKY